MKIEMELTLKLSEDEAKALSRILCNISDQHLLDKGLTHSQIEVMHKLNTILPEYEVEEPY